jgi:putative motility protein YjfB-like
LVWNELLAAGPAFGNLDVTKETFQTRDYTYSTEVSRLDFSVRRKSGGAQDSTQVFTNQTDLIAMTISGSTASTVLNNVANAEVAATDVGVAVLKKAQDQMKQQGEALIKMIEQTPNGSDGQRLDVYA